MSSKYISIGIIVGLFFNSEGHAQSSTADQSRNAPVFRVQVWGLFAADFSQHMSEYSALRSELEKGLPGPMVTDDVAAIRQATRALGSRVRAARRGARQGDIFTPTVAVAFKRALLLEMDPRTWASIMDDNPGVFSNRINGNYPDKRSLSTVPPAILAALPPLPDGIQYRFLGRHLILLDTRAGVILDRIPYAIRRCVGCGRRRPAGW
jgi:hypothetical protein